MDKKVATGFAKGPSKKPFGSDLADKRRQENRSLRHGKMRRLSTSEIASYLNTSLRGKTMAIGHLKVLEKENLVKRIQKDGVVIDLYDTKLCVFYTTDKSRVFEIPFHDILLQAQEALGALPPPSPEKPKRTYFTPPEDCVSVDTACTKLDITPSALQPLTKEMKNHGYTINLVQVENRFFLRKTDLDRMLAAKPKLIAYLHKLRTERSKS